MAKNYLHNPGISVFQDATLALDCGGVTAMHDPTEGGLAAAYGNYPSPARKKSYFILTRYLFLKFQAKSVNTLI